MIFNARPGLFTTKAPTSHNNESKVVFECIQNLVKTGIISGGAGWCISMSDIIQGQLKAAGIQSRLIEVSLEIQYTGNSRDNIYVGYDAGVDQNQNLIDTHVILITETEIPILIDGSIAHNLPIGTLAVVEELVDMPISKRHPIVLKFPNHSMQLTYKEKLNSKVHLVHQMSIIQRIDTDTKIFKGLHWLRQLVIVALLISTLNAARGLYDFYAVYIDKSSWGPSSNILMHTKIDNLEAEIVELKIDLKAALKK